MPPLTADELDVVVLTLRVALRAVAFGLPLALCVAYLLARGSFPGRFLLNAVVHLPLMLPPVV